jgi:hypothetical protein
MWRGQARNEYRILIGNGRSACRWKDNFKMHIREIGLDSVVEFIWLLTGTGSGPL